MKKILGLFFSFVLVFILMGCAKEEPKIETDALKFKEEYESLNGQVNASGKKHRTIFIDDNNPFIYITPEELLEKIENKETFYVYFGSKLCPWCRSVIEKTIEVAKKNNIETIYYIDIWDEEGNEILRDKYDLENNKLTKTQEGTESYYKLLEYFDNVLSEYTLTDEFDKEISTNEKRIFAPNYIYVEKGVSLKITEATSSKQTDSREELTDEMLEDEEKLLNDFFDN